VAAAAAEGVRAVKVVAGAVAVEVDKAAKGSSVGLTSGSMQLATVETSLTRFKRVETEVAVGKVELAVQAELVAPVVGHLSS
jgi:hypothetical protein